MICKSTSIQSSYRAFGASGQIYWRIPQATRDLCQRLITVRELLGALLCIENDTENLSDHGRKAVLNALDSEIKQYDANQNQFNFSVFSKVDYAHLHRTLIERMHSLRARQEQPSHPSTNTDASESVTDLSLFSCDSDGDNLTQNEAYAF